MSNDVLLRLRCTSFFQMIKLDKCFHQLFLLFASQKLLPKSLFTLSNFELMELASAETYFVDIHRNVQLYLCCLSCFELLKVDHTEIRYLKQLVLYKSGEFRGNGVQSNLPLIQKR